VSPFPVEGPEWTSHVVVVGGGIAGTSAALAATREGASAILLDGGTGASTLATGGIDLTPWRPGGVSTDALAPNVKAVLETLGGYAVPDGGARILTTAGVLRPARGHDAALLDVARLGQGRVAVVACQRPGWHADTLAAAWGAGFEKLEAAVLRYADEETIPDADFSARHDDEDRLGWLAERLRAGLARAQGRWQAIVLPPTLGVERPRAEALSRRVGVPCGEPISLPGGPSGLRFEQARDRALRASGTKHVRVRAVGVERAGGLWRVAAEGNQAFDAHAVVVATGGLLGGGLEYAPSEATLATALPPAPCLPFRLTLGAPLPLGAYGRPLELPGSLFGFAPERLAGPAARDRAIDRVGVLTDRDTGVRTPSGAFAAGELVADAHRTWLWALSTGARAGALAAREALKATSSSVRRPGEASASRL